MQNHIRLIIADDHPLVRSGIRVLLSLSTRIEVVAEALNGDQAYEHCVQLHPDILLLDLGMPGLGTLPLVAAVSALDPPVKVVIFSAYDDAATILVLLKTKIAGYLLKDEAVDELDLAIHAVADGGTWFSPTIQAFLPRTLRHPPRPSSVTRRTSGFLPSLP